MCSSDTSSSDTALIDLHVCRTGTPGALFRASRDEGPVRNPSPLPVSPEGDHFPRTPMMETYVVSPPPAPIPPRQHACRCIRGRNGDRKSVVEGKSVEVRVDLGG